MATSYDYADPDSRVGRVSQPAPARADPRAGPAPPCPVCGSLQCLCRPRFFPGQLLSDDDLNRLQQYVIDKNRLHNRYLIGWGVACGLEVVCDACDGSSVTVRAGYALSPCGDDIVVCADQSVDICALIQACRPPGPVVCDPPYSNPPADCGQGTERWVLAVCYDETPSRGITALTGAGDSIAKPGCRCGGGGAQGCSCGASKPPGGSSCVCGGAGDNGCSCGAKSSTYQPTARRRSLLPQCEPTQICEGFRFTAYKAPAPQTGFSRSPGSDPVGSTNLPSGGTGDLMIAWLYANRARFGPLLERALCCVLRAMDLRAALAEGRQVDAVGAVTGYRDYAQALQAFAAEFSLHHCSFVGTVRGQFDSAIEWSCGLDGATLTSEQLAELENRYAQLDNSWLRIVTECFCSALLPPCPGPANSNCVPLAVVTVDLGGSGFSSSANPPRTGNRRCRVSDICNWQERKLLITWPTVVYWLSWLPWVRLREFIARICCGSGRSNDAYTAMVVMLGVAFAGMRSTAPAPSTTTGAVQPPGAGSPFGVAAAATAPAPPPVPAEPAAGSFDAAKLAPNLLAHMLGDYQQARVGGASEPPWAALAARAVDGSAFAPLAGNAALREVDVSDIDKQLGIDAMREQVAALQQTVARQDEILRALQIVNKQGAAGGAPD